MKYICQYFIILTKFLSNTNDIHKIDIPPNKYCIHFVSKKIDGFYCGNIAIGYDNISTYYSKIKICDTENLTDYK